MSNVYKLEGINFGDNDIITLNVTIDDKALNALKKTSHDDINDLTTSNEKAVSDILSELEEQLADNNNFKDKITIAYENPEYANSYKQAAFSYEITVGLFANNYNCLISIA